KPQGAPIDNLFRPQGMTDAQQRNQLDLLNRLNRRQVEQSPTDSELAARIESFELAYRMQMAAPEALDYNSETAQTKRLYGDHNPHAFTVWLAGAGIKGGVHHGSTDDIGHRAVDDRVSVHDLHATILHLLGLDHLRLTYRYSGRDFRLTDVHGEVVRGILA